MKNKTTVIFGVGAVVLFLLMAFMPAVCATRTEIKGKWHKYVTWNHDDGSKTIEYWKRNPHARSQHYEWILVRVFNVDADGNPIYDTMYPV